LTEKGEGRGKIRKGERKKDVRVASSTPGNSERKSPEKKRGFVSYGAQEKERGRGGKV